MAISEAIRRAIGLSFPVEEQESVANLLEKIYPNQGNGSVEGTQAGVLALAYQDKAAIQRLIEDTGGDFREIMKYIEYPNWYRPNLTREDLVHRYRALGLPVHHTLERVAKKMK
jgi:hypothetical protein